MLIGFLVIRSLYNVISLYVNRKTQADKRTKLICERFLRCIDLAIDERLGNNILSTHLTEHGIKLIYSSNMDENLLDFYHFNSTKFGIIKDINLNALKEFSEIVDNEAKKRNFSFRGGPTTILSKNPQEISTLSESDSKVNDNRFLLRKYHDEIKIETKTLISIDKQLIVDKNKLGILNKLINDIFIVTPSQQFEEAVRMEILFVKDQYISAIGSKKLGEIEELSNLYVKLAEVYLNHIAEFGGGLTSYQARSERTSLFANWKPLGWLTQDISDIFDIGIQTHDKKIITSVIYLPIAIARRAIDKHDHLVFQEFITFVEKIYSASLVETDERLKNFLIDRSWRYMKEICIFDFQVVLQKSTDSEEEHL